MIELPPIYGRSQRRLNWRHQRAQGLVFAASLNANDALRDMVSGAALTRTGLTSQVNSGGRLAPLFGAGSRLDCGMPPPQIGTTTPFTFAWTQEPISGSGYSAVIVVNFGVGGTDAQFAVYQSTSDAGYNFVVGPLGSASGGSVSPRFSSLGTAVNRQRDRFVLQCLGGGSSMLTSDYVLWRNGVRFTTSATAALSAYRSSVFRLGALSDGSDPWEGCIQDVRLWSRIVVDTEAFEESQQQFADELYEPLRIWVPVSVAGGGSVSLAVPDAAHSHAADSLTLTTSSTLSIADALHSHAVDSLTLSAGSMLAVSDATNGHSADALALTSQSDLAVSDSMHSHAADALALTAQSALAVADATHGHSADAIVLAVAGATTLAIADATHAHTVDGLTLTAASVLAIQEALHAHAADGVTLAAGGASLLLADGLHAHTSDGLALLVDAWLVVGDASHGHRADSVVLTVGGAPIDPATIRRVARSPALARLARSPAQTRSTNGL